MESAVSMETKNVIWESATFDAVSVRLSAQRHGIRTDASTRYEKSLDPLLAGFATARIFDYLAFLSNDITVTVSIREDIAEEVIRIYGYDHIPLSPLTSEFSISSKNTEKSLRNLTLAFWE